MLQHLLNTSCIWLLSLACYDMLLAKGTHHSLNRMYLLLTLVGGAVLPLLRWNLAGDDFPRMVAVTLDEVTVARNKATSIFERANVNTWLAAVYLVGAAVTLLLLITDVVQLVRYYNIGTRMKYQTWLVVETGKSHAPFSFGRCLFVNGRELYTHNEWSMIVAHERAHCILYHIADVVLLQFAKVLFWFHPLVYLYNHRLRMVHEYQADEATGAPRSVYGRFLAEQALLAGGPDTSNSFNRSPIKNRIMMLNKRSGAMAKLRMLVLVPVAAASVLLTAGPTTAQQQVKEQQVYTHVDQMPEAGYDIMQFIGSRIKYPKEAKAKKVEGRVIVRFIVDEKGEVTNAKIMRGIGGGCDEEALAVVKAMPAWKPGKQNGKPVSVYYTLPVRFKLG